MFVEKNDVHLPGLAGAFWFDSVSMFVGPCANMSADASVRFGQLRQWLVWRGKGAGNRS